MPTYLVTGCQGKVGAHVVEKCREAGIQCVGIDLSRGVYDTPVASERFPSVYIQADLQDAGSVFSTIARFKPDVVIHVAAIPDPTHNPPHVVFQTNMMSTFNVIEACVRLGVPRIVNISSEQVPGFFASERVVPGESGLPAYCPVDEAHPIAPQNPYALSKAFGEQLCDAAVRRSAPGAISIVSIRPSWCQDAGNIERNLGPLVRDPALPNEGMWSYICIPDLADAILSAAAAKTTGHEVIYIAAADNAGGRDLAAAVTAHYGDTVPVRTPLSRPDASGIDCSKARRLLGWEPKLSWRDYLGVDGRLLSRAVSATKDAPK